MRSLIKNISITVIAFTALTVCLSTASFALTMEVGQLYSIQGAMNITNANGVELWDGVGEESTFMITDDGRGIFNLKSNLGSYTGSVLLDAEQFDKGERKVKLYSEADSNGFDFRFHNSLEISHLNSTPGASSSLGGNYKMAMDGLINQRDLNDITNGTTLSFWWKEFDHSGNELRHFDSFFNVRGLASGLPQNPPTSNNPNTPIPEPTTMALLASGVLTGLHRKRKSINN